MSLQPRFNLDPRERIGRYTLDDVADVSAAGAGAARLPAALIDFIAPWTTTQKDAFAAGATDPVFACVRTVDAAHPDDFVRRQCRYC